MEIGLALPQYDFSVPGERPLAWTTVVAWAQRAEAAGFGSVWLSDHLFLSIEKYGVPPGDHDAFEPLTGLAALACVTRRVRLGTLVLCAQLRPTTVLAKALATLDVVSGGRLTVGIGAGWFRPEYETAGIAFERPGVRVEQLAEAVRVLQRLFAGDIPDGGRHGDDGAGSTAPGFRPRPVQRPGPPVWVGGAGERVLGVAAAHAQGWNAGGWAGTLEGYRARLAVLERHCERLGRDPTTLTRSVNRYVLVGEDEADLRRRFERLRRLTPPGVLEATTLDEYRRSRLVGTPEQVREQLASFAAAGVSTFILNLGALPFSVTTLDDLELVASATK